jgi:tetratricopeptide (TPR) repeat protein
MKLFLAWKNKIASFLNVLRANYRYSIKDYGLAIDYLNEAISLNPNWAWLYRFRADAKEKLGQDKEAFEDLKSAFAINPNDIWALHSLGQLMERQGDYAGSIAALTHAIQLSPRFSSAYLQRGRTRRSLGENEGAIEDLTKAFTLGMRNENLHYERSICYFGAGRIDDALTDMNEALRISPNNADALVRYGLIWLEKGDLEQALANLNLGISKNPYWLAESYLGRARVRLAKNEIDLAIEDYLLAIENKPDCSDSFIECAFAFNKKGANDSAISYIQKAHAIVNNKYPNHPSGSTTVNPEYQRVLEALKWVLEFQKTKLKETENNMFSSNIQSEKASFPKEKLPPT